MAPSKHHTPVEQARRVSTSVPNVDNSVLHEAAAATEAERNMGLIKSLKLYRKACLWSIFLSTCVVMEGFDLVLLNSLYAYPPFQRKFGVSVASGGFEVTPAWQSGLSNGTLCGQIIGLFLAGIVADRFGYRKTLIGALSACAAFIFIIFFSESLVQLLIGEMLIGLPFGVFQTLTVSFAAEVCPTHLRAYLTTYVNLCWVIGQFIGSGVLRGMLARDDEWGYKIPFALQWAWPVPLIIGIYLAPESPWWLVRKERIDDAKKSLGRLTARNTEVSFKPDEAIALIIHTNAMEKEISAGTSFSDLFRGTNLRRTEIVCFTWSIQTLCGSSLIGYSTFFLRNAGLSLDNAFNISLAQYALGAVGTMFSWFLMGWFGRRTLYLGGQLAMFVLLLVIGATAFAGRDNVAAQWAIGSMLLVYTFTYDATVGPVCYSLISEISSSRLRTKSVVLARNAYNITGIVSNIITPRMLNSLGWDWGAKSGFFWAGSCLACAVWTYFRLPEPKGRTYGELDILFENRVSARKFKETVIGRLDRDSDSSSVQDKGGVEAVQVERVTSRTSQEIVGTEN